jgi:alcohol dehydrogenase
MEDIGSLLELVQAGKLKALVDSSWTLDRGMDAMARLENRGVVGKVIVTP